MYELPGISYKEFYFILVYICHINPVAVDSLALFYDAVGKLCQNEGGKSSTRIANPSPLPQF